MLGHQQYKCHTWAYCATVAAIRMRSATRFCGILNDGIWRTKEILMHIYSNKLVMNIYQIIWSSVCLLMQTHWYARDRCNIGYPPETHLKFISRESSFIQNHDDVIKWKHFPRYWPFVRGIHRSSHKGQWRGALMFSLIWAWINGWVNNRQTGDLRRHRAHHDVIVKHPCQFWNRFKNLYSVLCMIPKRFDDDVY